MRRTVTHCQLFPRPHRKTFVPFLQKHPPALTAVIKISLKPLSPSDTETETEYKYKPPRPQTKRHFRLASPVLNFRLAYRTSDVYQKTTTLSTMTSIHHNLLCREQTESPRCIHKKRDYLTLQSGSSRRQIGPINPWIRYRRNPPFHR